MAPLPEELGAHGLNRTEQSQSYPKLRKSDLWRRTHGVAPPTLPLDVERTEDVALTPDDLVHAEAVVLLRVVPGHPCLAGPMTSSGNVPL